MEVKFTSCIQVQNHKAKLVNNKENRTNAINEQMNQYIKQLFIHAREDVINFSGIKNLTRDPGHHHACFCWLLAA